MQASVKYSAEGGFKSSADDKIFNNYVVAPVKTKFDFSKALAGRTLKEANLHLLLKIQLVMFFRPRKTALMVLLPLMT